jgi:hypothetical protein
VHPQEVEDVLLAQPGVTDASVVGIPDETWGERVVAVVATRNGSLTEQDLRAAVRGRLAGYKVPRAIVLVPALPRTPTGKLELARVRRLASDVLARPDQALPDLLPGAETPETDEEILLFVPFMHCGDIRRKRPAIAASIGPTSASCLIFNAKL